MATSELPRDDLVKMLRVMQRDIDLLKMQSPLANTGLSVAESGSVVVAGGIQSSNYVAGVAGWRMDGAALEANTGVIGDGALANPVIFASPHAAASGFALTTSFATLASGDVAVPPGMTQLQVFVAVRMYALNPNTAAGSDAAGGDAIYVKASVALSYSTATPTGISGSGGFATTTAADAFTLTGLTPGAAVTLAVQGASAFAPLAADAGNYASVSAALSWSR